MTNHRKSSLFASHRGSQKDVVLELANHLLINYIVPLSQAVDKTNNLVKKVGLQDLFYKLDKIYHDLIKLVGEKDKPYTKDVGPSIEKAFENVKSSLSTPEKPFTSEKGLFGSAKAAITGNKSIKDFFALYESDKTVINGLVEAIDKKYAVDHLTGLDIEGIKLSK